MACCDWSPTADSGGIDDPYPGILSVTAQGVVTIKATIEKGKSESEDFIKEFTITVGNGVDVVYDAYIAVKIALAGDDSDALKTATEGLNAVSNVYNNFSEEHYAELPQKLGLSSGESAFKEVNKNQEYADTIGQSDVHSHDYT